MEPCLTYMTCQNIAEAKRISRALVEKKLVACANVIPQIHSVYIWEDKVQEDDEVLVLAKTCTSKQDLVMACIKSMHSYDCPAIVFLPITGTHTAYQQWLEQSLSTSN